MKALLEAGGRRYDYFPIAALEGAARLPYSLKVLLENLVRHGEDPRAILERGAEIGFRPARLLMPDSSGVPLLGDLAAMREAASDPAAINPAIAVDLVIDHSVVVDEHASAGALARNLELEMQRNAERYAFLRWAAQAFGNLRVVPPGNGILHQINLEHLARVVWTSDDRGRSLAYPDTVLGMDSHTPMVNGLGVLGWGVGGLEGAAAALGEPVSLQVPEVLGCRLTGRLRAGATATDLVLAVTQRLRAHGVVGKFVEYFGPGVDTLAVPDRATLANMSPEYGATVGYFAVDSETLRYLRLTGRSEHEIALVEAYTKAQGLWRDTSTPEPEYDEIVDVHLGEIEPSVAGPKRPQDRVPLAQAPAAFRKEFPKANAGRVAIAAITSCTNTSNPALMLGAGLLARNAVARGVKTKPWVKTSLSPGSRVVADYLERSGLQRPLDALGFQVVGFGCMTCMGNSGPLPADLAGEGAVLAAVLSGNRNFEGRIHPAVDAAFLASPPLVVAYALAGSMLVDLEHEPLGKDGAGEDVYLRDLWPADAEIAQLIEEHVTPDAFRQRYAALREGTPEWRALPAPQGPTFAWDPASTFIRRPPFFERAAAPPSDIRGARILGIFGDMVTTDRISPVGAIALGSSAARYLESLGVKPRDFVSYVARRLNHDVMVRGTFARDGLFDKAERLRAEGAPLVIIAGREYGAGSSRDWAAKGPQLLGVRAVLAESFERIHRSNLVGMGVLPLELAPGVTRDTLRLDGSERIDLLGVAQLRPRGEVQCAIVRADGTRDLLALRARVDTARELAYFRHGGLLHYLLRREK